MNDDWEQRAHEAMGELLNLRAALAVERAKQERMSTVLNEYMRIGPVEAFEVLTRVERHELELRTRLDAAEAEIAALHSHADEQSALRVKAESELAVERAKVEQLTAELRQERQCPNCEHERDGCGGCEMTPYWGGHCRCTPGCKTAMQ